MALNIKILMVDDDDQSVALYIEQFKLMNINAEILRAKSYSKANQFLEKNIFHFIFTEFEIDGKDSLDFAESIKKNAKNKNTIIAMITDEDNITLTLKDIAVGFDLFIPKPWKFMDFCLDMNKAYMDKFGTGIDYEKENEIYVVDGFTEKVENYYSEEIVEAVVVDIQSIKTEKVEEIKKNLIKLPLGINILLVEDSKNEAMFMKRALINHFKFSGIIERAETIAEAKEKIAKTKFDMVLCDLQLPGGEGGMDFLRHVRSNLKMTKIPFLLVTTVAEVSIMLDAIGKGVSEYLVKPWTVEELQSKLESAWNKHHKT